jgi:transcriptional regulator with XRE-family HTH domain
MGKELTEKREYAKLLFLREKISQKEIAAKVGVSEKTISKWANDDRWDELKASVIITRSEELSRIYMQIAELNDVIERKPMGERFANKDEAVALDKLTQTARRLETESSVSQVIDTSIAMLDWLRMADPGRVMEISNIFDNYIKSLMNR